MKLQTMMMGVAALGLVLAAFPAQAMHDCNNSRTQCEIVAGPGSVEVQGVGSVGLGLCQLASQDVPLFCDAPAGTIRGAGAATFDTRSSLFSAGNNEVYINIDYLDTLPCTASELVCGYYALICNDRDLDSSCTNVGDQDDQLWDAWSNEPASAPTDCDKKADEKDCGDPTTLGKTVCMTESVYSNGTGTLVVNGTPDEWNNADQIVVFIGAWAGKVATEDPNVGAGISAGTYEVSAKNITDPNNLCDNADDGETPSGGCIWEADALSAEGSVLDDAFAVLDALTADPADVGAAIAAATSGPVVTGTGVCDDDGGNAVDFVCTATDQALVVFVIGVGSSASTSVTGGCPAVSTTATSPVNSAPVTGAGTFQCSFSWTVVAIGGCLTV